jgi:hypothetical protein
MKIKQNRFEMTRNYSTNTLARVLLIIALVCSATPNVSQPATATARPTAASVLGTWKGDSICVGNRPACKNEIVVYRFAAVPGKVGVVLNFADKIIDGQRVPMGKLEFQYNEAKGELSCEFTKNQTHGLWQFTVSGDAIEGSLVLLPGREQVRLVKIKRVRESDVPKAPGRDEYEGT